MDVDDVKEKREYVNENQQTFMRVYEYLAEDVLEPKTAADIAQALDISRDQAFRACWNLADRGLAERAGGGYRLSPRTVLIAERYRLALADTLRRYLGPNKEMEDGV